MLHKTQPRVHYAFFSCLVISLTVLLINSCKKADTLVSNTTTKKEIIAETPENFLKLPENASPVLKKVAQELERQNKIRGFIQEFIKKEGFPVWSKSRLERYKKKGKLNGFGGEGLEDTVVYIPLVVSAEEYVTGFLKATVNDSVDIKIYRQNDYVNFPFKTPQSSTQVTTAEEYAMRMMSMDRDVFGTTEFYPTDKRLFNNSTDYSDTANIERIISLVDSAGEEGGGGGGGFASPTINNYETMVCVTATTWVNQCSSFTGSSTNNMLECFVPFPSTICVVYEIPEGGGNGGGGGGQGPGGGGSWPYPPTGQGGGGFPCAEEFGGSMINGLAPIECNPNGGNPWPTLPSVVLVLKAMLNLNATQTSWLSLQMHLTRADEIFNYLENNNGSSHLAIEHLNKMMISPEYLAFVIDHKENGGPSKMWWEDDTWLDDPDNFNLDITRDPGDNFKKLNAAEKSLTAQFPIQSYVISQNVQPAFDQSHITHPNLSGLNDKKDALRHAFFQAINTRDCPPQLFPVPISASTIVDLFADAHESEVPSQYALEKEMDMFNNDVGISYCSNCYSTSNTTISNALMAKIQAGDLRYLSPIDYTGWNISGSLYWDNPNTQTPNDGHHGIHRNSQTTVVIPTNQ